METVLVLAPTETDGSLARAALEAVAAAGSLAASLGGATFIAGLFGEKVREAANRIAGCGAGKFLGVEGPDFARPRYGTDAAAAEAICRAAKATIIIVSGTSRMARIAPGVAFRLGGRCETHATAVSVLDGAPAVNRWYYRQRMEAVLQRAQRPWVIALDPGCLEPWKGEAGSATVEAVQVEIPEACRRTKVVGLEAPSSDAQTIRPDAHLLFVAGAGWTKKQADGKAHGGEAEKLILEFLGHSKASLGGSKSLVDLSGEGQSVLRFMTHLNQVGQTGSTPRHPKGLATCCHGEEPHVVGWRFVSERRAVNLDPNCGWARGKADVVYVADAFAVMAKVNEILREKAAKS
jgi:electron transfer flavoprotein alpha subunit